MMVKQTEHVFINNHTEHVFINNHTATVVELTRREFMTFKDLALVRCGALLPDGRIFGQITQKRPPKNVHGRKKLEAVKLQNLDKSDRKEARKYLYNYLEKKPYNSLYFLKIFLRN
jgi:hypothetical protein